ncbi:MAG: hypothetical protein ACOC7V_15140, partial [Spirochaetota bacterium]
IYDSVHLLPIWEPGVVGSLYGMASWEINREFVDEELASICPNLDTPEAQLAAVTALLHLTGRSVGLDVIPHTDRYSEIVLAQPNYFEWLRRRGTRIVDHSASLHEAVVAQIVAFLRRHGPANATGPAAASLPEAGAIFDATVPEELRRLALFGQPDDPIGRTDRRARLITYLFEAGYEPVPATMAPPYRGIEVDPQTRYQDAAGRTWYDYRITHPEPMSRVFGPLTRYKFYDRRDDNRDWQVDFDSPRAEVFDYFCGHIRSLVDRYGFDFMRGDMSHVQMRPDGVPLEPDEYYDPLCAVKESVRRSRPSFAYYAETFLSPPGVMGYGDEIDHLEASHAEVTLGDLQSVAVGSPGFLARLRRYLDIAATRSLRPCFTVMTGDKDDPRFDEFYRDGNELRAFLSLLLPALPSYTALGFELRDRHDEPAANEYYTKLYVFHEESGPKATDGPYRFGSNVELFRNIERIRGYASRLRDRLDAEAMRPDAVRWLIAPDATGESTAFAWTLTAAEEYIFVGSTTAVPTVASLLVPVPVARDGTIAATLEFSTARTDAEDGAGPAARAPIARERLLVRDLVGGEVRVYRLTDERSKSK